MADKWMLAVVRGHIPHYMKLLRALPKCLYDMKAGFTNSELSNRE